MDSGQESPLTERQRYWLKHIQACEASGKTVADYALAQGINAKAMYAGKKELVKKGVLPRKRPPLFQRARIAGSMAVANEWRIVLPNGVVVVFSGAVDSRTLTTVLTAAATME
jgi:hypothetical protein